MRLAQGILGVLLIGCASEGAQVKTGPADLAYQAMDVPALTSAPRRVSTSAQLKAPLEEVWAYLAQHENLLEYSVGVITDVKVDGSLAQSKNGVGTKRECEAGKDRFVEEVVYFKAPYTFAYSARFNTWGLKDHLATVRLRPDGAGGTIVTWDQYFNHVKPEMADKVAVNLAGMLRGKILAFLTRKFGGTVRPS